MINGANLVKEIKTLQFKFELLVKEIKELQETEKENERWLRRLSYAKRNDRETFRINDRVQILNDILHKGTDNSDDTARNATVINIKVDIKGKTLVYMKTDNGYKTHRIPFNLKKTRK